MVIYTAEHSITGVVSRGEKKEGIQGKQDRKKRDIRRERKKTVCPGGQQREHAQDGVWH